MCVPGVPRLRLVADVLGLVDAGAASSDLPFRLVK